MKKYEKPEIYSEKLVIDTLRAQCCDIPDVAENAYAPEYGCPPCPCKEGGTPS